MSDHDQLTGDIERHEQGLRRIAARILRDTSSADDVVQEVWLAYKDYTSGGKSPEDVRAWLAGVTRNIARNEVRSRASRQMREHRSAQPERLDLDPEVSAEKAEVGGLVIKAIRSLKEPYRTLLQRHFIDGRSLREIAAEESRPLATIESRLRRGMERLRGKLEPQFGGGRALGVALFGAFDWTEEELESMASSVGAAAVPAAVSSMALWATFSLAAVMALVGGLYWTRPSTTVETQLDGVSVGRGEDPGERAERAPGIEGAAAPVEPSSGRTRPASDASDQEALPEDAGAAASDPGEHVLGSVRARVLDVNEVPVAGAGVAKYIGDHRVEIGATDADGFVDVPVLAGDLDREPRLAGGLLCVELVGSYAGRARSERVLVPIEELPKEIIKLRLRGPGFDLLGTVVNEGGAVIPGAEIFDSTGINSRSAREGVRMGSNAEGRITVSGFAPIVAGPDGTFGVMGLPKEPLDVLISAEGYGDAIQRIDPTGNGGAPGPLTITLEQELVLEGIVLDVAGAPAPGARVEVEALSPANLPISATSTDSEGRFRFERRRPGRLRLTAASGAQQIRKEFLVEAGAGPLQLQLEQGSELRIEVVDGSGAPVSGAHVFIRGLKGDWRSFTRKGLRTDEDGLLDIPGVPAATEVIVLEANAPVPLARRALDPVPDERVQIVVDLEESVTTKLTGVVTREGDALHRNDRVIAWKLPDVAPVPAVMAADRTGFTFEALPPGRYELTLFRPGLHIERLQLVDVGEEGGQVDLGRMDLPRFGEITIHRAPDETIQLSLIQAYYLDGQRPTKIAQAVDSSQLEQSLIVPAGTYNLVVRDEEGVGKDMIQFAVAPGLTTHVEAAKSMPRIAMVAIEAGETVSEGDLVEVHSIDAVSGNAPLGTAKVLRSSNGSLFVQINSSEVPVQLELPGRPSTPPFELGESAFNDGTVANWVIAGDSRD